jgi:hypothetical protein
MTRELLKEANQISHAITDLEAQITIVEDMHHCDNSIQLRCDQIGSITIAGDDELKDDIIDMVLNRLNNAKDDLEDKLRML